MNWTKIGSWHRFVLFTLIASASVSACGDGDGSGSNLAGPPAQTPTPAPANSPPTITGTAPTKVAVGQAYRFKPAASDRDQDKVTFTIANRPRWATFNADTGLLSGTPSASDAGGYAGIEIAATDGKTATPLPAFTLTVETATSKSLTVSWSPPTENSDGTPLVDLSGYVIYYGGKSKQYTGTVKLANPGLTRYVVEALAAGTYYVALTAVNKQGAESQFSQELRATLN